MVLDSTVIHETSNIVDDTVSTQKAWTIRKVMGGGAGEVQGKKFMQGKLHTQRVAQKNSYIWKIYFCKENVNER